jgi:hypothetical protein
MFRPQQPQTGLSATLSLLERPAKRRLLHGGCRIKRLAHFLELTAKSRSRQAVTAQTKGFEDKRTNEIRRRQKTKHAYYRESVNRSSTVLVRKTAKAGT